MTGKTQTNQIKIVLTHFPANASQFRVRLHSRAKHFRAVATLFEKHDANYLALVKLAAIKIWMRFMSR